MSDPKTGPSDQNHAGKPQGENPNAQATSQAGDDRTIKYKVKALAIDGEDVICQFDHGGYKDVQGKFKLAALTGDQKVTVGTAKEYTFTNAGFTEMLLAADNSNATQVSQEEEKPKEPAGKKTL